MCAFLCCETNCTHLRNTIYVYILFIIAMFGDDSGTARLNIPFVKKPELQRKGKLSIKFGEFYMKVKQARQLYLHICGPTYLSLL